MADFFTNNIVLGSLRRLSKIIKVRGAMAEAVAITYCVGVNCKGKKVKKRAKNKVLDVGEKRFFVMVFYFFYFASIVTPCGANEKMIPSVVAEVVGKKRWTMSAILHNRRYSYKIN